MNLQHLCSAPHVEIYFDTSNNWLFIDWQGDLTLKRVQHAFLGIARCYLSHAYPRVLNSNAQVTSITPDVSVWLATSFDPRLNLAGVKQMAWVASDAFRARSAALAAINRISNNTIALFDDIETAVKWLQQTAPPRSSGQQLLPKPLPHGKLHSLVESFAEQLHAAA